MRHYLFSSKLLLALISLLGISCGRTGEKAKPNIIFMMADDLGIYDLSINGQEHFSTPGIDRIAKEGISFSQMYAGNSWCAPSRASLLTGRHPGHASVRSNQNAGITLNPGEKTLASLLKKKGYTTGIVGKWGAGNDPEPDAPNMFGFDEAYGYINMWHAHNYYPEYLIRNRQKEMLNNKVKPHLENRWFPEYTGYAYERKVGRNICMPVSM